MLEKILKSPSIFDFWIKLNTNPRKKILKEIIKPTIYKKILEIGCGTGNLSDIFPKESYIGIDVDKRYIDYAKKKNKKTFFLMGGEDLKFKNSYFDYILLIHILHHTNDDLSKKIIKECSRVLKEKGNLIIIDHEKPSIFSFINYIFCKLDRGKFIRTRKEHVNLFSDYFYIEKSIAIIPKPWRIIQDRNVLFCLKKKQ